MMAVVDEEEFVASAVVYPGSTSEVQQVVLWANKWSVPIFPISMGRNRKYFNLQPKTAPDSGIQSGTEAPLLGSAVQLCLTSGGG